MRIRFYTTTVFIPRSFAASARGFTLFLDTELKYILKPRICLVKELIPRTTDLADAVAKKVAEGCEIIYLEGHGVVTVSDSLGMALELAELAEVIATRTVFHKIMLK
ncbi:MAG: class II aldolase/adducin family protein [Ignisphaera sp.]